MEILYSIKGMERIGMGMRIGIVTTWFERGAAYVSKQYMSVLARNNDVYIYARGGEEYAIGNPEWDGENVTWGTKKEERSTDVDLTDFSNWIKKKGIEIILFNEQVYLEPIILAKEMGIKVCAYIDYYTLKTLPTFDLYDFLLCNTKRHYSVFKEYEQCFYIPWGTDLDVYQPVEKENKDLVFFMSVGYAPRRKGADMVLRAFKRVKEKECKLIIHSQVDLVSAMPECELTIRELIEHNKLEVIQGSISAPGLYYVADVYVYPSWLDGIGLTLPEAISSGLAIITTNEPPMSEFVNEDFSKLIKVDKYISREDGYYWPLSIINEDSLYDCIMYFMLNNSDVLSMKRKARKYAEDNLNWYKNASILNDIFEKTYKKPLKKSIVKLARKLDLQSRNIEFRICDFNVRVNKINQKIANAKGNIAIYCAGVHTKKLLEYAEINKGRIVAIIDRKIKVYEMYNIKVITPQELSLINADTVIISSYIYQKEIEGELLKWGYRGMILKLYDENDRGEFYDV